jgi:formylglycine-generating enzyme required for sulfatase activity
MATSTTQLMDFTLGFAEADRPWADWITWVLESEGYTIEQKAEEAAFQLRIDEIQGQHYIPIWSQQYLRAQNLFLQTAQIVINYDLGQKKQVLPIQIDQSDSFPEPDLITPLNLGEGDRATAKQRLLEVARSLPLPFQPPPKPPFRKAQPPFPGQSQQHDWIQIKERRTAQGYIEKLNDLLQLEMIKIPAGTFMMGALENEEGSPDQERPIHQVTVKLFFMGQYPITQAQWRFVAGLPQIAQSLELDPSYFEGDNRPIEQVSSIEAIEFCDRLSQLTGRQYRLPSEAEWEYACRAGTTTPFHFGETIDSQIANYAAQGNLVGSGRYGRGRLGEDRKQTIDVGSLNAPNAFGLHDMHGNVTQWCMDNWHITYEGAPNDGSVWLQINPENRHSRVCRGGSWKSNARGCRSAFRSPAGVGFKSNDLGFRVVYSPI